MASLLDKVQDAVRTGTVGAEVKRSAQWFRDKIKGLEGTLKNQWSRTNAPKFYRESENKMDRKVLRLKGNLGELFAYYYNPKHRMTLPYYDQFPLIMLIGVDPNKETFLGLNFHYLNPKWRAMLLDRVSAKITSGSIINWNKIAKIPMIMPTVKRYRFDHVVRKVVPIEEKDNELAIFLPLERFKKASKSKVWASSRGR
jgi:hypothetical protein